MKRKKKQVDFTVRPRAAKEELPPDIDSYVRGEKGPAEPQKRLTLNLPDRLHKSFKARCVVEGITIQDKVRVLIEREVATDRWPAGEGATLSDGGDAIPRSQ